MLKSLKDLEKAIKLCRKLGVDTIEIGDIKFQLGAEPVQMQYKAPARQKLEETAPGMQTPGGITEEIFIPTTNAMTPAGLTEEQILFYSATGNEQ